MRKYGMLFLLLNLNFHTIVFVVVVVVEIVCLFDVFVVVSGVLQLYRRKK